MPIALFMKVDGATGESKNAAYKTWTEVESFAWGVSQPSTIGSGGGGGAGKVNFDELNVIATVDKVYPALLIKCAGGDHISKVELVGAKAGGEQVEFFKITLEDVMVTSCNLRGTESTECLASYGFAAAKIKSEYSEQTDKGGKGATSTFAWNIKENKKA